jgi:hypothetical protein
MVALFPLFLRKELCAITFRCDRCALRWSFARYGLRTCCADWCCRALAEVQVKTM